MNNPKDERRQYLRLDSVFPVQFRILGLESKQPLSEWLQGFTRDIASGGICLEVSGLYREFMGLVKPGQTSIALAIELPVAKSPVRAVAGVSWIKSQESAPEKYFLGLKYSEIDPRQNRQIIRYGRVKKLFLPVVMAVVIILGAGLTANSYLNLKLIRGNKALVEQLVRVLQETSIAKQKIKEIASEKEGLEAKIQALGVRIQALVQEKQEANAQAARLAELNAQIERLTQDKVQLQGQLITVHGKEEAIAEELVRLDKRKVVLEKANLDKMYRWLQVHQHPRTGLVMSFEGDSAIAGWAFSYDQSLAIQAYSIFSDFDRAKKILDFFSRRAKRANGMFTNAYYVSDGNPAEYVVHSGPNIWLGIAALQYGRKSQDNTYLGLAKDIAREVMKLEAQDPEGGVRGGPGLEWYSTEHNLDAYAFFKMLSQVTGELQYQQSARRILSWLVKYAYGRTELPVKRGKGDSTIATDTYAWSIAAVGPDKLEELGMNPDKIIDFAESACVVEVDYQRPEGQVLKIKGFDFAPQQHLARGGVISTEWTAQMAVAFKLMARYYYAKNMVAKARSFELKADEYLAQLGKLIICSPSPTGQGEGCLPYASEESVDTGHGWITPKGKSTGSIAGTSFALFAFYNYNPLELGDGSY